MKRNGSPDKIYGNFEWNAEKARFNIKEHGVTFEEASTVFDDPLYIIFKDPKHSIGEQRYIILGKSEQSHYLFVSYTERDKRTRIISARELTPKERKVYEKKKERF
jgi:uncharacterized DUF497 family protein